MDFEPENPENTENVVPLDPATAPIVISIDANGRPVADSRSIAKDFGKRHADVLRAIDDLIALEPEAQRNFAPIFYTDAMNRQQRCFSMDRDGFALLAMGFTGARAMQWKMSYIRAFNAMEAELMNRLPKTHSEALRAYADAIDAKLVIEADNKRLAEENAERARKHVEDQRQIEDMRPAVSALDRIAMSEGSLCITDAAKDLQIQPSKLFKHMRTNGWLYKRVGTKEEVAYQNKIQSGWMEHKVSVVINANGDEKIRTQARITASGLVRLAKEMGIDTQSQGELI